MLSNLKTPNVESLKTLITEVKKSLEERKVTRKEYKKSSEFLKNSLSFYEIESSIEIKIGNAFEEFIFAFFELENSISGIDYLTLNFSSSDENLELASSNSDKKKEEEEFCKKYEIYTVKEASSKDEDDTPGTKKPTVFDSIEKNKEKGSENSFLEVKVRSTGGKSRENYSKNMSKSDSKLSNNKDLIVERFKTPDNNSYNNRKDNNKSGEKTLKKLKKTYDMKNAVQNIYIDFTGDFNNLKLTNNESDVTIKNSSDEKKNKNNCNFEENFAIEDLTLKSNYLNSPGGKEDKSIAVSFIDIEKHSLQNKSSNGNFLSRSRNSSLKDSVKKSERFSSSKKKSEENSGAKKEKFSIGIKEVQLSGEKMKSSSKKNKKKLNINIEQYTTNFEKFDIPPALENKFIMKSKFQNKIENNKKIKIFDSELNLEEEKYPIIKLNPNKSKLPEKPNEVFRSFITKKAAENTSEKIKHILLAPLKNKKIFSTLEDKKEQNPKEGVLLRGKLNILAKREKKNQSEMLKKKEKRNSVNNLSKERLKELENDIKDTRNYVQKVKMNLTILKKIGKKQNENPSNLNIKNSKRENSKKKLETPEKCESTLGLFNRILELHSNMKEKTINKKSHSPRRSFTTQSFKLKKNGSDLSGKLRSERLKKAKKFKKVIEIKDKKIGEKSKPKLFLKKFSTFYSNYKKHQRNSHYQARNNNLSSSSKIDSCEFDFSVESFKVNSKPISSIITRKNSKLRKIRSKRKKGGNCSMDKIDLSRLARTSEIEYFRKKKSEFDNNKKRNLTFFLRNRRKNIFGVEDTEVFNQVEEIFNGKEGEFEYGYLSDR